MSDESIVKQTSDTAIARLPSGFNLINSPQVLQFAESVSKSGLAPKGLERAEAIIVALQMASEVGLSPMAGLQNIGVINGRPSIYGDAALAIARASGDMEGFKEEYVGENPSDEFGCKCTVKRRGFDEISETFTVADAKRAGLWGKAGPWTQYPKRMLKFRARGFALRDAFGDYLKGMRTFEEERDFASMPNVTGTAIPDADPSGFMSETIPAESPKDAAKPESPAKEVATAKAEQEPEKEPAKKSTKAKGAEPAESAVKKLQEAAEKAEIPIDKLKEFAASRQLKVDDEKDARRMLNGWTTIEGILKPNGRELF